MNRRLIIWIMIALALAGLLAGEYGISPARAQEEASPEDSGCYACHQERYWLFDRGKAACFCAMQGRCTDCHAGQPEELDADLAHAGLISSPARDNAAACARCHPGDYQARAQTILSTFGSGPTPAALSAAASPRAGAGSPGGERFPILERKPLSPWQVAGLGAAALSFAVTLLLGRRFWKLDRAAG